MAEAVIYVSLFIALFFEVFAVLTFFEKDAKRRRQVVPPQSTYPSVAIIVPCFNEEKTVGGTVESLLNLEYPKNKLSITLVNDGSTDNTQAVMDRYAEYPQIQIIHKANGGKHTGLNAGIAASTSEFIGCLDADSFVEPDALNQLITHFDREEIGAVTASMSVFAPKSVLERMQQAEYLFGIALRHILSTFNGIYVTPGPFTIFRRSVFEKLGTFKPAHNTEDMEIALRMQKHGFHIQNAPGARVYTKVPRSVRALIKQRTRWTSGFLRNGFDYRELFGNPKYGVLGLLVLPLGIASILTGISLFVLSLIQTISSTWVFILRTSEVPLSFTFRLPTFDLFFVPITTITLLGAASTLLMFGFMFTGAYISKTKTNLGPGIIWYIAVYSLLAPLWLMRSVADVALGVRRNWR